MGAANSSNEIPAFDVPACTSVELRVDGNRARQVLMPSQQASVLQENGITRLALANGDTVRLVASASGLTEGERALKVPSAARRDPAQLPGAMGVRWVGDLVRSTPAEVLASLDDAFEFLSADPERGRPGLRRPQLGAVHAFLGYATTGSAQPVTVVMPTGTGKTETMVALLAAERPERLLVVVPSDVLRDQIAGAFETLGVLQESGVVAPRALRPVVGRVRHKFSTTTAAEEFATACNVIVTTPGALFASDLDVTEVLLATCSHLFVDEAHHVEAATWRRIRDAFAGKPVVQFTATPFREDGRQIVGRSIYTFALREAQNDGYFSRINYLSVVEFDDPDRAIATKAIERLREDLAAGCDHLLMARVRRIGRAGDIRKLYAKLAPDLNPVVLHSTLPAGVRREALEAVRARESRIIVCVDMLGEGFDLPSLKIAAIHDPHKSIGITLQFVGRFARVAADIGDATVVVGRPEHDYDDNLRKLYAEDADWNHIIRDLSEAAIGEQEDVSEFEEAFGSLPEEVSLRNLEPKMSTVVFRTACESWRPHGVHDLYPEERLLTVPIGINEKNRVAWFVTESRTQVRWGDLRTVEEVTYDLYVLYWDEERQLLYINSSNNASLHEALARAVCGESATLIKGEPVYRAMAGIQRLVPTNVGVLDFRNRSRRFSLHVGADVTEGFPTTEAQTKTQTNIFAWGYEQGERVSVGGSLKGRVWSYRVAATLKHWTAWCDHIGSKLSDDGISVDAVMRNFIRPRTLDARPDLVPLGLEWPWEAFWSTTEETRIEYQGKSWPLIDVDLAVAEFSTQGPIPFSVSTPEWDVAYEAVIADGDTRYRATGDEVEVVTRNARIPLSAYFEKMGPSIFFEQDAMVVPPAILIQPDRDVPPFDLDKLAVLDWGETDLSKESQGASRDPKSVQARVIQHVLNLADWDLVIDDDGSGEIADIVAMRVDDGRLVIKLVHCKATREGSPGARVADLYELCGQAQKSVQWRRNIGLLFRHLIRREKTRRQRHGKSGFEKGDGNVLYRLDEDARLLRPELSITVAQPGVSKAKVSPQQLELLGATELYLHEAAYAPLDVLCSL